VAFSNLLHVALSFNKNVDYYDIAISVFEIVVKFRIEFIVLTFKKSVSICVCTALRQRQLKV